MIAILVWVLITSSDDYSGFANQLGNYADLESCQRVQKALAPRARTIKTQCVQVKMIVGVN